MDAFSEEIIGGCRLVHGDCLDVLRTLEANSIDAIVTDPPYGLAQTESMQSISQRIYKVLSKIGFPNFYQWYIQTLESIDLAMIAQHGSLLRREDGTIRVNTRIGMPECPVDLQGNSRSNPEIDHPDILTCCQMPNSMLSLKGDTQADQFLGDFVLKLGDMDTFGTQGDMLDSALSEAFPGGFAVPICAQYAPCFPGQDTSSMAVILGNTDIRCSHNALRQTSSAPCVMAFPRTVNSLMLRFDVRGTPVELLATYRANHLATLGTFGCPQLIRACPTTRGLSSMAKAHRIRLVLPMTDGAYRTYWFHLWTPVIEKIESIIPQSGFMGKEWDASLPNPHVWRETMRVLKPGGHLIAFGGTRTHHRLMCALEDAGFEIRDCLAWVYGSGFPKSLSVSKALDKMAGAEREVVGVIERGSVEDAKLHGRTYAAADANKNNSAIFGYGTEKLTAPATDAAKQWDGWGTALKPAMELIVVARKPLSEPAVAANVLKWGTGALNIDGCRVGMPFEGARPNYRLTSKGIKGGAFGNQDAPPPNRLDGESSGPHLGRWPANVVLSDDAEVLAMFPRADSARSNGNPNNPIHTDIPDQLMSWGGIRETHDFRDTGSAARFFYTAKVSPSERDGSTHPTMKPVSLMRWLVRLVTQPRGLVLDPFLGSGTTALACLAEGRRCLGIEREAEYIAIARQRLTEATRQGTLFAREGAAKPSNDAILREHTESEPQCDLFNLP